MVPALRLRRSCAPRRLLHLHVTRENAIRPRVVAVRVRPFTLSLPITHNSRPSRFPPVIPMSTSDQTAGPSTSTDNFTAIFNAASIEYQTVTGNRLDTHPFAAQLDTCDSPNAISDLLRAQAQAFSKFRKSDEKLMAWLDPTVHILFTFSATLGEGIGLVSRLNSFSTTVL